jgi:hypothetical protein
VEQILGSMFEEEKETTENAGETADRVLIHADTELGRKTCSTTAWPKFPFHAAHTVLQGGVIPSLFPLH